jgi:hypothetical protein
MNREANSGTDRLRRMRKMFAAMGAILKEDYLHFTRQDEPNPRSKAPRKLAARYRRPAPEQN